MRIEGMLNTAVSIKQSEIFSGAFMALLLVAAGLAAAENETQLIKPIKGEITVDADGVVKSVSLTNTIDDKFGNYIIERIKSWPFYPMEVNGEPVEVTTGFNFNLIATFRPDKKLKQLEFSDLKIQPSALEIANEIQEISDGNVKHNIRGHYTYPTEGVSSGAEAYVVVALDLTAEGTVRNAEVLRMSLYSVDKDIAKLAAAFEKSAIKGAKQGIYREVELAKYKCANGCVVSIEVNFKLSNTIVNGWKTYHSIPVKPIPWVVSAELKKMNAENQSNLVRIKADPSGQQIDVEG